MREQPLVDALAAARAACDAAKAGASYREWLDEAEQAGGRAVVFERPHVVEGHLWLDELEARGVHAVIALAGLIVRGVIVNERRDRGLLLFVNGRLEADAIAKGGARLIVLGDLLARGPVVCDYNHGIVRVSGDAECEALIVIGQDVGVDGQTRSEVLDWDDGDLRERLVDDAFVTEDAADPPDGDALRRLVLAGRPVLRAS